MRLTTARIMQIGVVSSFLIFAGVVAWRSFEPPKIEWVSVSLPVVEAEKLSIKAEVRREPIKGCSNGPQLDLKRGVETIRLPVPTRTINGTISLYETVLADQLVPGKYIIRLRETVICPGLTEVSESPGIEFEVLL